MMQKITTLFFALMIGCALGAYSEEEMRVRLATEVQLLPIYIGHVNCTDGTASQDYCRKLERVLQFDLNYNGMTYVVPNTTDKDRLANSTQMDKAPTAADWKDLQAFYLVKLAVVDNKLQARLFSANSPNAKSVDGLFLTGDLAKDRRQVHLLADSLFKALFDREGIATTRVLYTVKHQQPGKVITEVWEADYDGENKRKIISENNLIVMPVYVPPKEGFASGSYLYVSYQTGQPKIYYQSLAGGEARRLSLLKGNQLMPAMNKQRDLMAFISDVTGNPDLFILPFSPEAGATGKPYQIFATHQATQGTPSFSPSGQEIAFVSNKDGAPRIYTMKVPPPGTSLNEIKATLLTKRNRENTAPAWSPDGTKIAYCSITDGVRQIWVYDLEKREERQLTQGGGNKENPSWAPDSLHLVFNASNGKSTDLYIVNLNQSEAAKITSGPGEKRFPSWEPRS